MEDACINYCQPRVADAYCSGAGHLEDSRGRCTLLGCLGFAPLIQSPLPPQAHAGHSRPLLLNDAL